MRVPRAREIYTYATVEYRMDLNELLEGYIAAEDKKTYLAEKVSAVEDLKGLRKSIADAAKDFSDELSKEDLDTLDTYAEIVGEIDTQVVQRRETAERTSRAKGLLDHLKQEPHDDEDEGHDGDGDGGQPDPEPTQPPQAVVVEEPARELVAASAASTPVRAGRLPSSQAPASSRKPYVLVAGVDAPEHKGEYKNLAEVSKVIAARFRGYGSFIARDKQGYGGGVGGRNQDSVALFRRQPSEDLVITEMMNERQIEMAVDRAADMSRLPGGSLTAAAGWCSVSETIYDLCPDQTSLDGIPDLPRITVRRGGVRWPVSNYDIASLFSNVNVGRVLTEAQVIAESPTKTCIDIPCPTWVETRLDVVYECLNAGILQRDAYPEQIEHYTQMLLAAHAHKLGANMISRLVTASTAVTANTNLLTTYDTSAATQLLESAEYYAEWQRSRYRLAFNSLIEQIWPAEALPLFRADLARRNGVDLINITNAQVNAWFQTRGIRVQWVRNWQMFEDNPVNANQLTSVQFLSYVPGTFVWAEQDVIRLDTIYDSTKLATNEYTQLFVEDAIALLQRCYTSLAVTVNGVCASGTTASANALCTEPVTP